MLQSTLFNILTAREGTQKNKCNSGGTTDGGGG